MQLLIVDKLLSKSESDLPSKLWPKANHSSIIDSLIFVRKISVNIVGGDTDD